MDSLTQAALGAMMGELCLGRKWGRKAMLAGALIGTIPDLDILAYPFLDSVARISWHRGLSHSLLGCIPGTLVCGYLVHLWGKGAFRKQQAYLMAGLAWTTHILIDVFTAYGTQIFEPFSSKRVSLDNLFIIDPLFTLPLIIGLVWVLFLKREHPWRLRMTASATTLTCLYTLWSFFAQYQANSIAEESLRQHKLQAELIQCGAGPLTTLYWYALAEAPTENGYYYSYVCLHDDPKELHWHFVPRGDDAAATVAHTPAGKAAIWFAEGHYEAWQDGENIILGDLRLGSHYLDLEPSAENTHPSLFRMRITTDGTNAEPVRATRQDSAALLKRVWQRICGAPPEG